MLEILAPAGDEKSFFSAIAAGANAVYLGLSDFSARKNAANFNLDNLKYYIDYARVFGVRVYVAMNTLVKENEIDAFVSALVSAHNYGADAIIMQDIFLGKLIKEKYPEITLHLSTQAGVCNVYGAKLAKRYGFSRVILARETPLSSIKEIAKIIETETFIQGALCTCFSGQCYMSSFVGANSGNRGYCKQPCRKKYKINRKGFDEYAYAISLSDLCIGSNVKQLIDAGVVSFKIEGRMRSPEYVYSAVDYYKKIIFDNVNDKNAFSALKRTFNRGDYTKGYLFGQDKNLISRNVQNHMGEEIGIVKHTGKFIFIESNFKVNKGDGFKIIRNGEKEIGGFVYSEVKPKEKNGFYISEIKQVNVGDKIYITSDTLLAEFLKNTRIKRKIYLDVSIKQGEKIVVTASGDFKSFTFESSFSADIAKNAGLTKTDVVNCFLKTDTYPFEINFKNVSIGDNVFVLLSMLNAFRREFYEKLFANISYKEIKSYEYKPLTISVDNSVQDIKNAVIDSEFNASVYKNNNIDYFIFKPNNYKNIEEIERFLINSKYYVTYKLLYLPAYLLDEDIDYIKENAKLFDGLYVEGTYGMELAKELNLPFFVGTGFNVFNSADIYVLQNEGVKNITLSKELSIKEIEKIKCLNSFVFSGGNVKVMDLEYCPFSKSCKSCDKKNLYEMTDEGGRKFILRRYECGACRFEIFNCAPLVFANDKTSALYDFTGMTNEQKNIYLKHLNDENSLKNSLKNYTFGHIKNGIK